MRVFRHFLLYNLGFAQAETQTTPEERACLRRHASGRRRAVEIGVWHGVTTAELLESIAPEGVLYAVDPFEPGRLGFSIQRSIAIREVAKVRPQSVRWMRMTGAQAAQRLREVGERPVDFVFIDGDHSYEGLAGDWAGWAPLVAEGGVVALHDSRSSDARDIDDAGSARFTREVILADDRFEMIDAVETLTVMRRKDGEASPGATRIGTARSSRTSEVG